MSAQDLNAASEAVQLEAVRQSKWFHRLPDER